MGEEAASRSVILEHREERRSMAEGHAFLEEKCLLLAGEIVRELARLEGLRREADGAAETAGTALAGALARHGLEELSVLPARELSGASLALAQRAVMGVRLADAALAVPETPAPAGWSSPESRACADAFAALLAIATRLGAVTGNLERLSEEYRRAIRRARALADVLIPERDRLLAELETRLEDLEREDAIGMRLKA
jgi:V/A-type H+-transporting ATPase subunit D